MLTLRACRHKVGCNVRLKHPVSRGRTLSRSSTICRTSSSSRIRTAAQPGAKRMWLSGKIPPSPSYPLMAGRSPVRRYSTPSRWSRRNCRIQTTTIVPLIARKTLQYRMVTTIKETRLRWLRRTLCPKLVKCYHKVATWTLKTRLCCSTKVQTTSVKVKARP